MALISCPECGKPNISDTAEMCPECGYGVKEHFEREKRKKEVSKQQRVSEERVQIEWEKLQAELEEKLREVDNLKPSSEPAKPSKFKHMFYYNNTLSMFSWSLITAGVLFVLSNASELFTVLFAIVVVLGIPFAAIITYLDWGIELNCYKKEYANWKFQQKDWDRYIQKKKEDITESYRTYASNMANYGTRDIPILRPQQPKYQPKCPACGNTDIERISTMDRSVSIAMVGLASGKIGKQYKCKKCKHMW